MILACLTRCTQETAELSSRPVNIFGKKPQPVAAAPTDLPERFAALTEKLDALDRKLNAVDADLDELHDRFKRWSGRQTKRAAIDNPTPPSDDGQESPEARNARISALILAKRNGMTRN